VISSAARTGWTRPAIEFCVETLARKTVLSLGLPGFFAAHRIVMPVAPPGIASKQKPAILS
jgi:hypothetical protein